MICNHCSRPIRSLAPKYTEGEYNYHLECTHPNPAMNITKLHLDPSDALVVQVPYKLSDLQRKSITSAIANVFTSNKILVLDYETTVAVFKNK